jgi:hypothetical protein
MEIINLLLKIIPILGIIPFLKAIWEYIRDLKWKKSEFLSKEIKEFQSNENSKITFQLLDWNSRKIKLKCGEYNITDYDLISALQTHNKKSKFSIKEAEIRDIFDEFFDKLSTFNIYINNGLISEKELYEYIGYYVNTLTSENKKPKLLIDTFNEYIQFYEFKNVSELIERFKKRNLN